MAFLGPLLAGSLPFLGRAITGALGGVGSAIQRGGGIGDVLKGATLGALQGGLGIGQPATDEPRIQAKPIYNPSSDYEQEPQPVRRKKFIIPMMRKKSKVKRK